MEPQLIVEEFARRKARQKRLWLPVTLVSIAAIWMRHRPVGSALVTLFFLVAIPIVFGALAVTYRNWRCPACNTHLGKRANPETCPSCGAKLA
jgi:hypothetical protein